MKRFLLITLTILFAYSCSSSKFTYAEKDIENLKDPKLLFAYDYLSEGISLGMIGLEIKFGNVDYDKASGIVNIKGQVIDETVKEPVTPVKVYIGQKMEYEKGLNGYKILLSDSALADKNGFFEIKSKLQNNTVITSKVVGYYGHVYNIGKLN